MNKNTNVITDLDRYTYIRIAKGLRYGNDIIKRLRKAKSIEEANRAMRSGRERLLIAMWQEKGD